MSWSGWEKDPRVLKALGKDHVSPASLAHAQAGAHTIGVDPGRGLGFAVYEGETLTVVRTITFWDFFDMALRPYNPGTTTVVLEDPAQIGAYFKRAGVHGARELKIAQNVGENKGQGKLVGVGCERLGYRVVRVKPAGKKWSADDLAYHTGWQERTSEHARDAVRLAFTHLQLPSKGLPLKEDEDDLY